MKKMNFAILSLVTVLSSVAPVFANCEKMEGNVSGISCASCTKKIKAAVSKMPNVASVKIDVKTGKLTVKAKPGTEIDEKAIQEKIQSMDGGKAYTVSVKS